MNAHQVIEELKKFCDIREEASFESEKNRDEGDPVVEQEHGIRDSIDSFREKISKIESKIQQKRIVSGIIYRAIEPYDEERPEFDCFMPESYADGCYIGDCFVCDEHGNKHPDMESPVPVNSGCLGDPVSLDSFWFV